MATTALAVATVIADAAARVVVKGVGRATAVVWREDAWFRLIVTSLRRSGLLRNPLVLGGLTLALLSCCALVATAGGGGSSADEPPSWVGVTASAGSPSPLAAAASPSPSPPGLPAVKPPKPPAKALAVGVRTLTLSRGDRPLPTTVWYPAQGKARPAAVSGAAPANGRFPLVLYSHGIGGLPAYSEQIAIPLAAAGYIVAAPTYPFTKAGATPLRTEDVDNQPADASMVITEILQLDSRAGDPLFGHVYGSAIAAAGFSGGGLTTAGLLGAHRDLRIKAGVIIAGGAMGAFQGPDADLLFIHGDADAVISYARGKGAYDSASWHKAFITMVNQGHGEYLRDGAPGYQQVMKSMLTFLRWTLYGDAAAAGQLRAAATAPGITSFEAAL